MKTNLIRCSDIIDIRLNSFYCINSPCNGHDVFLEIIYDCYADAIVAFVVISVEFAHKVGYWSEVVDQLRLKIAFLMFAGLQDVSLGLGLTTSTTGRRDSFDRNTSAFSPSIEYGRPKWPQTHQPYGALGTYHSHSLFLLYTVKAISYRPLHDTVILPVLGLVQ